ncbi:hypothetical protein ACERIM_01975 [Natrinema sp. H-ect1]|uniref:hypothetical protein n=1 Tax=Natrinema sp. H-ect1 TaxID=3242700 RepID=UPI00359D7B29
MSGESDTTTALGGLNGTVGWLVGGAVSGAAGGIAFGIVMWLVSPDVLTEAIPALFGLEPTGAVGWAINVGHGVALGLVFGLLVTREFVLGVIRADVETDALSRAGMAVRLIGAGFVYGLAVWTVLPLLILPVWIDAVGGSGAGFLTGASTSALLGHALFGIVLGAVFAATVDLRDRPAADPF